MIDSILPPTLNYLEDLHRLLRISLVVPSVVVPLGQKAVSLRVASIGQSFAGSPPWLTSFFPESTSVVPLSHSFLSECLLPENPAEHWPDVLLIEHLVPPLYLYVGQGVQVQFLLVVGVRLPLVEAGNFPLNSLNQKSYAEHFPQMVRLVSQTGLVLRLSPLCQLKP